MPPPAQKKKPVDIELPLTHLNHCSAFRRPEHEVLPELRSEDAVHTALASLPAAIYTCDADGRVTFYNEAAATLWGRRPELGVEKWCGSWKIYHPDGSPMPLDECPMAIAIAEKREVLGREIVVELPNGSRKHILVYPRPVLDDDGALQYAINMLVDVTDRRTAERRLSESEARYRAIVENQIEMICRFHPDGTLLFANRQCSDAMGFQLDALAQANFWDYITPDDRPHVKEMLDSLTPEHPEVRIEHRLQTVDGERWMLWINRALTFDADGRVVEAQSSGRDVTPQKLAEEALRVRARQQEAVAKLGEVALRERDLQTVLDHATNAVAQTLDVEFCKVLEQLPDKQNLLMRAGIGWRDGLVGTAIVGTDGNSQAGFSLAQDEPVVVHDLRTETRFHSPDLLVEHGVVSGMSCIIRGAGGEPWGVIGAHSRRSIPFTKDDVNFLAAVANVLGDAIYRDHVEQALRESEARFRTMADAAPAFIWIAHTDKKSVWFNKAWLEFTGRTMEEELESGWTQGVHPDDLKKWTAIYNDCFDRRQPFEAEFRLRSADGVYRWILSRGVPRHSPDGSFAGYIGACIDIDGRKRMEAFQRETEERLRTLNESLERQVLARTAELERQNKRLRQLARELTDAEHRERRELAEALHDGLQQILVAVKMHLTSLELPDSDGSVPHLHELLDQAIGASRSLAYELSPPALYRFNLPEALNWLARWFEANHRIKVTTEMRGELPFVAESIKAFLFNAVRELLLNSVKHSNGDSAAIQLHFDEHQRLHIVVSDEGQGFDPSRLTTEGEELFGLGLISIRERLIALGGVLDIDAKPGEGARFDISVPLMELDRRRASGVSGALHPESTIPT